MRRLLLLILLLSVINTLSAQKYTISGYVREKATGEELIGANVYIKELSKGTISNTYGFYSLTIPAGNYILVASFIGYKNFEKPITLNNDIKLNISLEQTAIMTKEVVIESEAPDENVRSTEMSTIKLPVEQVRVLPSFMGETDILRTIQLLPGVQSAGEGNTGFYVRGGGPDQNLILLDEAVVYNASHLFGFFSVFNADVVKDINLIKGGMPAQYGGRLSSVLDISMKEGNSKKLKIDGGIGLISSRLTIQGPIKKDTCSYIISGRRTYADIIINPFIRETARAKGSGYYFYDLNTKINYRFSDKDRLYLSGYFGRDVFTFKSRDTGFKASIPWGNATTSLRWNHLFSNKLFMNTTAIFSDYKFEMGVDESDFEFKLFSGITDFNLKMDFSYMPGVLHTLKFGVQHIYHIMTPGSATARIGETEYDTGKIIKQHGHESAVYINDDFDISDKLRVSAGIRGTIYTQTGPFDRYVKDAFGTTTDTIHYDPLEKIVTYKHLEPRLSLRYILNSKSSFKASFTQNYQYIHLASLSSVSLPTDIWVSCSSIVEPQFGTQYAVGYFRNFKDNTYETSVELYYKKLKNQIEYKDGASPGDDYGDNADNNFTFGNGESYGIELFLKKRYGKTTGWIGYTLSKTTRTFPEINYGNTYPAKYDRLHDVSLIITHEFNDRWTFSTVFVYSTGNALTIPIGRYMIDGKIINEYGDRNSFRMPAYNRGDISVTYQVKKKRKIEESWSFSVYNVYSRFNPYFIYVDYEGSIQSLSFDPKAYMVSLIAFPIPAITWNFRF